MEDGNFDFFFFSFFFSFVMTLQPSCGAFCQRERVMLQASCGAERVNFITLCILFVQ